jgi:hypothetical protein
MNHPLVGKIIRCHLESAAGNSPTFMALVRPGRYEGEVFLEPATRDIPKGYQPVSRLYVEEVVPAPPELKVVAAPPPVEPLTLPPAPPAPPASSGTPPAVVETVAEVPSAEPPPVFTPDPEPPLDTAQAEQPELTDPRRLSESPVSAETRRKRGRGAAADHGANAAQPDEYQPRA